MGDQLVTEIVDKLSTDELAGLSELTAETSREATRFKKGNQRWKARLSHGRKPIFDSPQQLWDTCVDYFQWCDDNPFMIPEVVKYRGVGKVFYVPKARPYTVLGLCVHLNISRQTWSNYRCKPSFDEVFERVDSIIYVRKFELCAIGQLSAKVFGREIRPCRFMASSG